MGSSESVSRGGFRKKSQRGGKVSKKILNSELSGKIMELFAPEIMRENYRVLSPPGPTREAPASTIERKRQNTNGDGKLRNRGKKESNLREFEERKRNREFALLRRTKLQTARAS